jgi:hypothetical protein
VVEAVVAAMALAVVEAVVGGVAVVKVAAGGTSGATKAAAT